MIKTQAGKDKLNQLTSMDLVKSEINQGSQSKHDFVQLHPHPHSKK